MIIIINESHPPSHLFFIGKKPACGSVTKFFSIFTYTAKKKFGA